MNYWDIESLKSIMVNIIKQGSLLDIPSFGVGGRVVGVGFKPYWTNLDDSKIEKMELNLIDSIGRVFPFSFYNIVGFDIVSPDSQRMDETGNAYIEIFVFSPNKSREAEPYDKIRVNVTIE